MIESKVEMKQEAEKDEYPKLMIHKSNVVVLFISKNTGMAVSDGNYDVIGDYSTDWTPSDWITFHGTITLSNK